MTVDDKEKQRTQEKLAWHALMLRRHGWAFVGVGGVLIALKLVSGWPIPVFWIMFCWGIPLAVHFFYVKSISVDNRWVDERARELRLKSYDFSHIKQIQDSYNEKQNKAE